MQRDLIIKELSSLRIYLNKGNKTANIQTKLSFKIEETGSGECRLLVSTSGQGEFQKLELVHRNEFGKWEASNYSGFGNIEELIVSKLTAWESSRHALRLHIENYDDDVQKAEAKYIQKIFETLDF